LSRIATAAWDGRSKTRQLLAFVLLGEKEVSKHMGEYGSKK